MIWSRVPVSALFPESILAQVEPDTDAVADAVEGLTVGDWLVALAIFVGSILLAVVGRKVLNRLVARWAPRVPPGSLQLISRVAGLVVVVCGFVYALSSIGVDVGLFVGALGIGGIALAFAFQDILENFMAGVILQAKRPFRAGDYVEIGESQLFGIVQEIDSRSVIIDTFAGDRIVLPAAEVLKNPIVNWTARGRHRLPVPIGIHYRHEPQDAIDAIQPRLAEIDEVLAEPAPRVLVDSLDDSAVNLVAYVWHDAFGDIFFIRHRVIQEAKRALDAAGIEIPFPQRVLTWPDDHRVSG